MRKLYFLLPGTKGKFGGGGLWAELKIIKLAQRICEANIVTYRQKEDNNLFLTDVLKTVNSHDCIFVVNWGFDVPKLISKLKKYHVIYHAHSADYGFRLPSDIPIITVSRNTMGYWGEQAANSLIYYLPNQLGTEFYDAEKSRDIDVLVQTRKSSQYLLKQLIPALQSRCKVQVINGYVEDLAALFNRSKIYLYDSAEYWIVSGVTEGFGLPPLEALACGCNIFSSVNHALADYLDPGFNCYKIGCYSLEYDLKCILKVINSQTQPKLPGSFWEQYKEENLVARLEVILKEINIFFDSKSEIKTQIKELNFWQIQNLKVNRLLAKVKSKSSS
ncbi:Glycosyltransferase [Hyella patelloides LEGE 07179]|uniref:Glycosyltransferase n=1 Tax=Hyella patelloides LEGE 07179 TaxID=945734 RepID=A0A563VSG7_9CYAN|nr:glycosyltransferase [Hyella patelloides]VEP14337.1 Glycosyltransferase [Hyella patelloides LEGE 07179]